MPFTPSNSGNTKMNSRKKSAARASAKAAPAKARPSKGPSAIRGSVISLETPATSLVLAKSGDVWTFAHLGRKAARPSDFAALSAMRPEIGTDLGFPTQETYPAFGSDRGSAPRFNQSEKRGALQATHADGNVSVCWKCVRASELPEGKSSRHVALELADAAHPGFRAVQHFRAWADCDVFETWVEIRNGENGPVRLGRMDSFGFSLANLAERFHVTSLGGAWANEANVSECEVKCCQELRLGSRSGVRDAWENNPAFFLSFGGPAAEESGRVLAGALCWSGAWEISFRHHATHELQLSAGAANLSGPYVLDAGASIELPKFVFAWSGAGKGPASRALHRWARLHRMPHPGLRDVLLNDWEGAYFDFDEKKLHDMMDGTKELGGELFVVDDGWFGRGEYARNDDLRGLGDWFVNREKLPHGLGALAREAEKRGLKFGLWFEPEMANTRSELVAAHPDWFLQEEGRPVRKGRGEDQVVLDMANPAVRDEIFRVIDGTIREIGTLAYIKWDANADFMDLGSPYLGPEKQGNLWFDYTRGVYDLFARLRAAHPEIVFQACSSGGAHCEYGFLGFADEFWGSDDSCSQQRVFIQWGESHFYPASAMAAHVTAVPNHQTGRDASLKFRFDVAMSGRLGFELHPKNMTPEEVAFAKRGVETYKRIRPVVQQGDLYRLASPYETDHAALAYVSEDRKRAVAFVYGENRRCRGGAPDPLRIPGLDPSRRYRVEEIDLEDESKPVHLRSLHGAVLGGDAIAAAGIPFCLRPGDDSVVVEFTAV